jgi:peptidyl-prolyl cis-trans isomerase B (cyclophilin B)
VVLRIRPPVACTLAAVLFLASAAFSEDSGPANSHAEPEISADEIKSVDASIKNLDSDEFATRDGASKKLIAMGVRIKPLIEKRLSGLNGSESAEVRLGLKKIFDAIDVIRVVIETSQGDIEVELYPARAPQTVRNFMTYVAEKFYDGTVFHRVIENLMIQGGGFTVDLKEKDTHAPIKNEADNGLNNAVGTIAMARAADPHSAAAQFFINVNSNVALNHVAQTRPGWGYCVFGKVVAGMDVVNKIKAVKTGEAKATFQGQVATFSDVPVETVLIKSIHEKK